MKKKLFITSAWLAIAVISSASAMTADAEAQNAPMMACAAIASNAMASLDPNIKYIAGDEFSNKAISDCIWLIEEAKGDPKRAEQGYSKLMSHYSDYLNQMMSSPLTDNQTRYVLVVLSKSYQYAMGDASHAASDYKYLRQQADITKNGFKGILR